VYSSVRGLYVKPRRIAQVARTSAGFSPEATVVVVAADQIEALAGDRYVTDTVMAQLASADLLILNKIDRVDQTCKQRVLEWLRGRAPRVTLIEARHADVPIEVTLGSTMSLDSLEGVIESDHSDRFTARVLRSFATIDETKLHEVLNQLSPCVLRFKGFVRLDSDPQRLRLLQGVGSHWTISDADPAIEQEGSALALIGAKSLLTDQELKRLRELFAAAPN
jgi:G3E family GTPase